MFGGVEDVEGLFVVVDVVDYEYVYCEDVFYVFGFWCVVVWVVFGIDEWYDCC